MAKKAPRPLDSHWLFPSLTSRSTLLMALFLAEEYQVPSRMPCASTAKGLSQQENDK